MAGGINAVNAKDFYDRSTKRVYLRPSDIEKDGCVINWLIDGVLAAGSITLLDGKSGYGKSYIALDIALSIASGKSWNGFDCIPGKVLWIIDIIDGGTQKRHTDWRKANNAEPTRDFFYMQPGIDFSNDEEVSEFVRHMVKEDFNPRLIVVDSSKTFKSQNWLKIKNNFDWVLKVTGAAILLIDYKTNKLLGPDIIFDVSHFKDMTFKMTPTRCSLSEMAPVFVMHFEKIEGTNSFALKQVMED